MRSKLVVEGAGVVGAAALMEGRVTPPAVGTTVVVLSGERRHRPAVAGHPPARDERREEGRALRSDLDRPGSLARLLTCIGLSGANLVTVEHLREGYDLHVRETAVHIVLETRNREHAKAVLDAARSEGFDVRPVSHAAS